MLPSFEVVSVTGPQDKHRAANRKFQGIPGIALSPRGRLFGTFYGGGEGEGPDNYVVVIHSDDGGESWSEVVAVVDPPHPNVRAYDPTLWLAPDHRFFLFWSQTQSEKVSNIFDGRAGVWYAVLENPDDDPADFRWTEPVRIGDGVMMNKPTVLSDGSWALPVSVWAWRNIEERFRAEPSNAGAKLVASEDGGRTFRERGKVVLPAERACFDEHMILEQRDGRLRMLIRVNSGIMEACSPDGGRTWTTPVESAIRGPNSRPFIRRLRSGRVLLVNHDYTPPAVNPPEWGVRDKLTAWLSDDDGQSWPYRLLLDERVGVSYPDGDEDADGNLLIVYDYNRHHGGFINIARIREADIVAGALVSAGSRLRHVIASCAGAAPAKDA